MIPDTKIITASVLYQCDIMPIGLHNTCDFKRPLELNFNEEIFLKSTRYKDIYLLPGGKMVKIVFNTDNEFEGQYSKIFGDTVTRKKQYFLGKLNNLQHLQEIGYEGCRIINVNHQEHVIISIMNYYHETLLDIYRRNKAEANRIALTQLPELLRKARELQLVHHDVAYRNIAVDEDKTVHLIDLDAIEQGKWYELCLIELRGMDSDVYRACVDATCY